jgi:TRAP-type C4-dicarboxylate transport system permease small subunit
LARRNSGNRKTAKPLESFNENLLILLTVAMIIVLITQVVLRTFFARALPWGEEVCRYLFIYIIFGGAAIGFKKGIFISVNILNKIIPEKFHSLMDVVADVVVLIFFAITVVQGVKYFLMSQWQYTPGLGIEIRYVYLAIPIFGLQMCYYALRKILKLFWPVKN